MSTLGSRGFYYKIVGKLGREGVNESVVGIKTNKIG